ncbi:hypothetical protein G3I28_24975, partial [Streptomyces sp. SID10116]|nr:hypothetical protein [Streptomyces sp. SID10116]
MADLQEEFSATAEAGALDQALVPPDPVPDPALVTAPGTDTVRCASPVDRAR